MTTGSRDAAPVPSSTRSSGQRPSPIRSAPRQSVHAPPAGIARPSPTHYRRTSSAQPAAKNAPMRGDQGAPQIGATDPFPPTSSIPTSPAPDRDKEMERASAHCSRRALERQPRDGAAGRGSSTKTGTQSRVFDVPSPQGRLLSWQTRPRRSPRLRACGKSRPCWHYKAYPCWARAALAPKGILGR
jgi:hypothetical protein